MGIVVGFRVPQALAGDDNEVEADEEGMRKVLEMIAGTALGAGILASAAYVYQYLAGIAGAKKQIGDLY